MALKTGANAKGLLITGSKHDRRKREEKARIGIIFENVITFNDNFSVLNK